MAGGQGPAGRRGPADSLTGVRRIGVVILDRREALAALRHEHPGELEVVLLSVPGAAGFAGVGLLHALSVLIGRDIIVDCGDDAGLALAGLRAGLRRLLFTGRDDTRQRLAEIAGQLSATILAPADLPDEILAHPWARQKA